MLAFGAVELAELGGAFGAGCLLVDVDVDYAFVVSGGVGR